MPSKNMKNVTESGFTLIEMLVVMVILALTTGLLTEGLSTTWRSFERLSVRNLMSSSAQLSVSWFEKSVSAALLYHPDNPLVKGGSHAFEFVSFASPDDERHIPQRLVWRISTNVEYNYGKTAKWILAFQSERSVDIPVAQFVTEPKFEYWDGHNWLSAFVPTDGRLALAARIVIDDKVWAIAKPGRPVLADVPVEMPIFGAYEF